MRRALLVVAVVAALGGLFLFGLLRGQPDRDIASARIDRRLPDFSLPLHAPFRREYGSNFEFASEELERPLVVNFWATWCLPCRDEAPVLEAAWRRYGDRVTILGVQTQDPGRIAGGLAFIDEFGLTFPNVIDNNSRVSIDWGLFGVPETYFLRADGTLAYKHTGIVTEAVLNERIGALLQ
jgi:cytochrome c biogenesis protein CcmG/thiol:disulfide interchange protein DsbE